MRIRLVLLFFMAFSFTGIAQAPFNKNHKFMPWPKSIVENKSQFRIDSDLTIAILGTDQGRARKAAVNFLRRLSNRTGVFIDKGFPVKDLAASIVVSFDTVGKLDLTDDESYTLEVLNDKIAIHAKTDIGALYGLQTLLQAIDFDEKGYYFQGVKIEDEPRFVWRGLMIDVARHFEPIGVLKRNLDAMASVKLNVFHWHLTDDQGFRVESKTFPRLHEEASDGSYYTHEQITDIVNYASDLGIRVIPEFDVPGHASAILTAYPELGSKEGYEYSVERYAGVFDPTLDPTNEKTYEFLDKLFEEMTALFPDEYFHIGGDENEGKHWTENKSIQRFKKKKKLKTNHDLQTYFNIRLEKTLNKLGKKLMGWDEIMTENMPKTSVIHSWRGENEGLPNGGSLIQAAKSGYQTVLSNGFYIDRMLSVEHHYKTEPIGDIVLSEEERSNILGGEATMWGELVTPLTIDSRIWPRTAAIAERFWSSKHVRDIDHMLYRLKDVNNKLEELDLTHIKNRDVILRSMANHQDISALQVLSKISEPLKIYSRNAGGTEYKSFSPFTLFADACVVDAEDARPFNVLVNKFVEDEHKNTFEAIDTKLLTWAKNFDDLSKIAKNPNVIPLLPMSQNLSGASKLLSTALNEKEISQSGLDEIMGMVAELKKPYVDVEVVVTESLEKLTLYCKDNYLLN